MSFYKLCLVLALFLTQLFVIESYAKEANNIKFVTLTAKEIQALPAQKRIEYIKELRELVEASEKTQNAFYGAELYANSNKLINQFLQHILISEAWAVDTTSDSCIIAGNVGVLRGGRCSFTEEQKKQNEKCGANKWACNPSLYGDNVCIDIASSEGRRNATANCNKNDTDYANVLKKYNKDRTGDIDAALKRIADEAESIFGNCKKARESKKITSDQKQTCEKLEERIANVGAKSCEKVEANQRQGLTSGADQLQAARIKSCNEAAKKMAKDICESKAAQFDIDAKNLTDACKAIGHRTSNLVSPACYPELRKCSRGNDTSDKCYSTKKPLTSKEIENEVAKLKDNFKIKLNDALNTAISSCFPKPKPFDKFKREYIGLKDAAQAHLDAELAHKNYQKFLELETTYNYEKNELLQTGLRNAQARDGKKTPREFWGRFLSDESNNNKEIISTIEKNLEECQLHGDTKKEISNKMEALRLDNDTIANKFKQSEDLAVETKGKESGMLDTNEQFIKNKKAIQKWFNDKRGSGTYEKCCLKSANNAEPYLSTNRWCDKTGSSIAARVYGLPLTPEEASGEADSYPEESSEPSGDGGSGTNQ